MNTFSDIFNPGQLSYLAVLGQSKFDDQEVTQKLGKKVPAEFKEYRFLMHPNRMSIMRLLYNNFTMASADMKNQLQLSWGEFASHVSALEKRGFVTVNSEFQDGIRLNVIYLEEVGRREFENLVDLLKDFLLGVENDYFEKNQEQSDLYPET